MQIVTMDDGVAVQVAAPRGLFRIRNEWAIGNSQMMVIDELLSFEVQLGHMELFEKLHLLRRFQSGSTASGFPGSRA
jgi:hypothetical protein